MTVPSPHLARVHVRPCYATCSAVAAARGFLSWSVNKQVDVAIINVVSGDWLHRIDTESIALHVCGSRREK